MHEIGGTQALSPPEHVCRALDKQQDEWLAYAEREQRRTQASAQQLDVSVVDTRESRRSSGCTQ
jgi:hypothetical protein